VGGGGGEKGGGVLREGEVFTVNIFSENCRRVVFGEEGRGLGKRGGGVKKWRMGGTASQVGDELPWASCVGSKEQGKRSVQGNKEGKRNKERFLGKRKKAESRRRVKKKVGRKRRAGGPLTKRLDARESGNKKKKKGAAGGLLYHSAFDKKPQGL